MSRVRVPAGMSVQQAEFLLNNHPFEETVLGLNPTNYWPANAGVGIPNDVVAGTSTTMTGTLAWTDPSPHSNGYAMDWVNDANKRLNLAVSDAGVVTWQMAVQPDEFPTDRMILGNAGASGYFTFNSATQMRMQNVTGTTNATWSGLPTFTAGTWYLLHIVRTSTTSVTLYIDGVSQGAQPIGTAAFGVGYFGRYQAASGFDFNGRMNHFARWSGTALTATQIAALHSRWAA